MKRQVRAKLSVVGVTKSRLYEVCAEIQKYYTIILDNGDLAMRHKCLFEE